MRAENSSVGSEAAGRVPDVPGEVRRPRILAVRRGALGDFILTLPALRALLNWQAARPPAVAGFTASPDAAGAEEGGGMEAEVHLLTLPAYGKLARHFGFAGSWRSVESASASALFSEGAEIAPDWREWLGGFESIVSWLPDRDGVFRRQLAACGAVNFHQAPWLAEGAGPAARQFGALPGLHCQDHALLPFPGTIHQQAELIALHPGSGSARKNWPFSRWLEVMAAVQRSRPETRWLLITGEAEAERLGDMAAGLEKAGLPWESAASLDLLSLASKLRECGVLLGHDSGISHLASACGLPCFLLFGPTDPGIWAPAGAWVSVLRAPGGDLSGLPAGEVAAWVLEGLENSPPAPVSPVRE